MRFPAKPQKKSSSVSKDSQTTESPSLLEGDGGIETDNVADLQVTGESSSVAVLEKPKVKKAPAKKTTAKKATAKKAPAKKAPAKKSTSKKKVTFLFEGVTAEGVKTKGKQLATTELAAHEALLKNGITVTKIRRKVSILQYEITKKKVKPQIVSDFSRQLAVYIDARVSLPVALELLNGETPTGPFKKILQTVSTGVRSGRQFSDLLAEHAEAFPTFYCGIIHSAELTSNLPAALVQLADYMDRDAKVVKKVVSALIYPAMVALMGIAVAIVSVTYVLPQLQKLFQSLHAKLPLITRVLLGGAKAMQAGGPYIALLALAAFVAWLILRRTAKGQFLLSRLILRVPIVGKILRLALLERITRVLSTTLHAGVPLPEALDVAASATKNVVYRNAVLKLRERILAGISVSEAMTRSSIWPNTLRQLVMVGETSGSLDQQLGIAGEVMSHDLDTKIGRALAMIEPAIMTATGAFAAFISIALVSSMYGMYSQVQVPH